MVDTRLLNAVNDLCSDYKKVVTVSSGYRSSEKQKIINTQKLKESKGNIQHPDGSVYNSKGQCIASAYGKSNHCFGLALDIPDEWFKMLTNSQLKKYQLIKPMSYEPWHVEYIPNRKFTQEGKKTFLCYLKSDFEYLKNIKKVCDKFGFDFKYWSTRKNIDTFFDAFIAKMASQI
jgi:hypothetical protein